MAAAPTLYAPDGSEISGTVLDKIIERLEVILPPVFDRRRVTLEKVARQLLARYPWLEQVKPRPRGWVAAGVEITCVPDAALPPDPAVVRAIRNEFDPRIVPVFVRKAYRAPSGGLVVRGFHAIASHVWNPTVKPAAWTRRIVQPTVGPIRYVTHMDLHLEDRALKKGNGLPGGYMPFDWRVYTVLRRRYNEWTFKQRVRHVEEHGEAARSRKARLAAERRVDERTEREAPWLKRRLESITLSDVKQLLAKEQERKPIVGPW